MCIVDKKNPTKFRTKFNIDQELEGDWEKCYSSQVQTRYTQDVRWHYDNMWTLIIKLVYLNSQAYELSIKGKVK